MFTKFSDFTCNSVKIPLSEDKTPFPEWRAFLNINIPLSQWSYELGRTGWCMVLPVIHCKPITNEKHGVLVPQVKHKSHYPVLPRILLACCVDVFVEGLCRFVLFQSNRKPVGMSSLIFWLQLRARELRLLVCFMTLRNFNRSLNKRRMSPAQIITTEHGMNDREMWRRTSATQTNAKTQAKQLKKQMVEIAGRRSPPKQQNNGNNAKGSVDWVTTQNWTYESHKNLDSFSLSILSEIS